MEKAKLSTGLIQGSCGVIQKGMKGAPLYVAEGFETGASIALADSKATVLCSFGASNMKNLSPVIQKFSPKEVIIAGDNDGKLAKSQLAIEKMIDVYQQANLNVRAIFPENLNGKVKTDWNDIHLSQGIAEIQTQLMKKDMAIIPFPLAKSFDIPKKIADIAYMKAMKLTDSQIGAICGNAITVDNSRNLNQLVATYHKHYQDTINKSFVADKSALIKIHREKELEL